MQNKHSVCLFACLCLISGIEERIQTLIVSQKVEVYSGVDLVSLHSKVLCKMIHWMASKVMVVGGRWSRRDTIHVDR
jgi:hypothetical protein